MNDIHYTIVVSCEKFLTSRFYYAKSLNLDPCFLPALFPCTVYLLLGFYILTGLLSVLRNDPEGLFSGGSHGEGAISGNTATGKNVLVLLA